MSYKPIISIDFDGVIHSYTSGWSNKPFASARIQDGPVPGAISALLGYLDAGFKVAIFSSRSKTPWGRWAMKRWLGRQIAEYWRQGADEPSLTECECWGDAAGIANRFSWPWFKPSAVLTIDDRAFCFEGNWPTYRYIREFRPWNKKSRPAIAEVEEILRSDPAAHIEIQPDGTIRSPYGAGQ